MKKVLRIVLYAVAALVLIVVLILGYLTLFLPRVPLEKDLSVEITQERLIRGKYLANNVMGCLGCHAERDWSRFNGPIIPGTEGTGGERWGHEIGFPGEITAPNITPYRLKDWSDAELFRAITAGVGKDGRALIPLMPFFRYGMLDREEIYSVMAYIRSIDPVQKDLPVSTVDFPLNLIFKTIPKQGTFHLKPDRSEPIKYGEYITTAAVCYDCHTPMKDNQYDETMAYAGGGEFKVRSGGMTRSANLTPDPETGLGKWTKDMFIKKFKVYADSSFVANEISKGQFNSEMPWQYYAQMSEEDLGAIYDYLFSLPPIKNPVIKFTPEP